MPSGPILIGFEETRDSDALGVTSHSEVGPAPEEHPRGSTLSRYVILGRLGAGGMGVVYAAYDPELDRKIALKVLHPAAAGSSATEGQRVRLLREAQAMARLVHPNVVTVHDVGAVGDEIFIAMEFVRGGTLRDWLRREPVPDLGRRLDVLGRAGRGLVAAHAAGLVHRDFKPDNVLVSEDGGDVRVADFGLARPAEGQTSAAVEDLPTGLAPSGRLLASPLTAHGAIVGTPAYMAPEQHLGAPTDARTDQFSFCVAAYESLYGELPFEGRTVPDLAAATLQGRVREPPSSPKLRVPAHVRRVLLRGLRARADERYPSMTALLTELARDPQRTRRRFVAFAGGVVAVAASALLIGLYGARAEAVCQGAERRLDGVWDASRRALVEAAFHATGKPFAGAVLSTVVDALDRYARGWTAMHVDACEATRVRGEQSEDALDLRMQCLTQRRRELGALVTLLAATDATLVERSVQAVERMRDVAACADLAELSAPLRPPSAAVRASVDAVRAVLATAQAERLAARWKAAEGHANAALAEARKLEYAPLLAEALYALGLVRKDQGQAAAAVAALEEAQLAAERGRHDALVARVRTELVYLEGTSLAHPALGHRRARFAEAAIARIDGEQTLEARLVRYEGTVFEAEGKLDETLAHYEKALALLLRLVGPDHVDVGWAHNNLGNVLSRRGRLDEAIASHERARAVWTRALGPDHPQVAVSHSNHGFVLRAGGRFAQAASAFDRAIAIAARSLAPEHPDVAMFTNGAALARWDLGELGAALARMEQALRVSEKVHGSDHPEVALLRINLGDLRLDKGEHAAAGAIYAEVLAAQRRRGAAASTTVMARALAGLGGSWTARGDAVQALRALDEALKLTEGGKHDADLAEVLTRLAEAHLLPKGDRARAAKDAARALTLLAKTDGDPNDAARAQFARAQAIGAALGERAEAVRLAQAARAVFAKSGGRFRRDAERVGAWLQGQR